MVRGAPESTPHGNLTVGNEERVVDEQRQAEGGTDHPEASAWRVNGTHTVAGARGGEQAWSSAGAALEPSAEPLALLANHGGTPGHPPPPPGDARHRQQQAPGLDDDTPAGGVPAMEPPLWREAARHSRGSGSVYASHYPDYSTAPVMDPGRDPGPQPGSPPPPPPPSFEPPTQVEQPPTDPVELPAAQLAPTEPRSAPPPDAGGLPQRVPAEPDVPVSRQPVARAGAESSGPSDRMTAPELAWIADQLRRSDVLGERPPEKLDVDAVVAAVREVSGVESATVRTNPTGIHTLRLDLADDADPGQVSSTVARLLLERMGLSAAPQHVPQARTSEETTAVPLVPPPVQPSPPPQPPPVQPSPPPPVQPSPPPPPPSPVLPESRTPLETEGSPLAGPVPTPAGSWEYEPIREPVDEEPVMDDELTVPPPAEKEPEVVSRPIHSSQPGPRVVIDQVQVSTFGLEATVEVELTAGDRRATGEASGPAVDSYVVRLAAIATAKAIDELLRGVAEPGGPSRCFVEHTGVVSFGNTQVAITVVLLVCGGWVEKLTGSALVDADPRQAVVRATLGAVNRRLEALLD